MHINFNIPILYNRLGPRSVFIKFATCRLRGPGSAGREKSKNIISCSKSRELHVKFQKLVYWVCNVACLNSKSIKTSVVNAKLDGVLFLLFFGYRSMITCFTSLAFLVSYNFHANKKTNLTRLA